MINAKRSSWTIRRDVWWNGIKLSLKYDRISMDEMELHVVVVRRERVDPAATEASTLRQLLSSEADAQLFRFTSSGELFIVSSCLVTSAYKQW
jgi:hypothetical protein